MVPDQIETPALHRVRLVLGLLEQLDQAGTARQLGLGCRVEVGAEGREGLELAELRQVQTQLPATFFIAFGCAAPPTRDTEMPTLMAGRTPELNRSDSKKH